jgi:putative transposase
VCTEPGASQREGVDASKRVERVMRSMGLSARPPRRFRITPTANERHLVAPNRVARDVTASKANERWVTDISYVWTNEGWAYVTVILDLFSRAVVGWALDTTLSTRLPEDALKMALTRRNTAEGLGVAPSSTNGSVQKRKLSGVNGIEEFAG